MMETKTYKREVAGVMLLYLAIAFGWGIYNTEAMEAARFLTLPIFGFAAGAFTIDAVFKQGNTNDYTSYEPSYEPYR